VFCCSVLTNLLFESYYPICQRSLQPILGR